MQAWSVNTCHRVTVGTVIPRLERRRESCYRASAEQWPWRNEDTARTTERPQESGGGVDGGRTNSLTTLRYSRTSRRCLSLAESNCRPERKELHEMSPLKWGPEHSRKSRKGTQGGQSGWTEQANHLLLQGCRGRTGRRFSLLPFRVEMVWVLPQEPIYKKTLCFVLRLFFPYEVFFFF